MYNFINIQEVEKMLYFTLLIILVTSLMFNYINIKENYKLKKSNKGLKLQRTYFEELLENSTDGILILDNKDRIMSSNKAFERLFQYKSDEIINSFVNDIIAGPEIKDAFELSNIVMNGDNVSAEAKRKRKDGVLIDVNILAFPVMLNTNQIGVYAVYKNITDKKEAERALELQRTYFRQLFENSPEAICIIDTKDRFIDVNYAFEKLFGYTKYELINYSINQRIVQSDLVCEASKILENVMDGNVIEYETIRMRKDKTAVDVCILGYPIIFQSKQIGVFGIYKDIAQRKKIETELTYISTHDGLTGLYNRSYFEKSLNKYDKEKSEKIGMIVCDVDGLKLVNDNLGHDFGDKLLTYIANIIKDVCSINNCIASRIGGDEFVIILNDCCKDELEKLNEWLKKAINEFNLTDSDLYLSISTGTAYMGEKIKPIRELFIEADNNMYQYKTCKKQYSMEKIMYKVVSKITEAN